MSITIRSSSQEVLKDPILLRKELDAGYAVELTDLGAVLTRLEDIHALADRLAEEELLEYPFAGSRMLRGLLAAEGCKIGRRHVRTLMRRMGIEALYRRPRTTTPEPGHKIYRYLLRGIEIARPNQVWAMDR